ncbi:MAG: D-tyrosyl-tRNA(Tyr) deacylase [Deltaproteobacteria bacterium]|nr:D-tyrosyl-tRNA(Tyr) deacylase [Deltaproteobacteria bacterium]
MRAVIQRVDRACVRINHQELSSISEGILILLGVEKDDTEADADYILEKAINLRIFEDEYEKMNRSLLDTGGAMMVVSQFTLLGNCIKGRRPSFGAAEEPAKANKLYEYFVSKAKEKINHLATGKFQEMMKIELVNDGPVTILLDSRRIF